MAEDNNWPPSRFAAHLAAARSANSPGEKSYNFISFFLRSKDRLNPIKRMGGPPSKCFCVCCVHVGPPPEINQKTKEMGCPHVSAPDKKRVKIDGAENKEKERLCRCGSEIFSAGF